MKVAALVFLAAATFAAALILGAVSLDSTGPSPQPIALHESPKRNAGSSVALRRSLHRKRRVEVPQRVEITTLSAYRAHDPAGGVH